MYLTTYSRSNPNNRLLQNSVAQGGHKPSDAHPGETPRCTRTKASNLIVPFPASTAHLRETRDEGPIGNSVVGLSVTRLLSELFSEIVYDAHQPCLRVRPSPVLVLGVVLRLATVMYWCIQLKSRRVWEIERDREGVSGCVSSVAAPRAWKRGATKR